MLYMVIFLVSILVIFIIARKNTIQKKKKESLNQEKKAPRDFIRTYSYQIDPNNYNIRKMLIDDKDGTVDFLISCLTSGYQNPKAAAYILGQIGDKKAIEPLFNAISNEKTIGNKEAMEAAVVAIQQAPTDEGYSELERREIIDKVYYKQ